MRVGGARPPPFITFTVVPPQELHKIAVHVRAVGKVLPFPCQQNSSALIHFYILHLYSSKLYQHVQYSTTSTDKHNLSVCSFTFASTVNKETRLKNKSYKFISVYFILKYNFNLLFSLVNDLARPAKNQNASKNKAYKVMTSDLFY